MPTVQPSQWKLPWLHPKPWDIKGTQDNSNEWQTYKFIPFEKVILLTRGEFEIMSSSIKKKKKKIKFFIFLPRKGEEFKEWTLNGKM